MQHHAGRTDDATKIFTLNRRPTDAQVAAAAAIRALQEERFELGFSFARIAVQAHRIESRGTVHMPMHPHTPIHDGLASTSWAYGQDQESRGWAMVHGNHTEPVHDCPYCPPTQQQLDELAAIELQQEAEMHAFNQLPVEDADQRRPMDIGGRLIPITPGKVVNSARCKSVILQDGVPTECHRVLVWNDDPTGRMTGWFHMDMTDDHPPVAPDPTASA